MEAVRSYPPIDIGLPSIRGGSAPALPVSGPAQRSHLLRPTDSPSRLSDPLHRRLQQLRFLHYCSDCYRVERTSSRAGFAPAVDLHLFTAHAEVGLDFVEAHSLHGDGDFGILREGVPDEAGA